MDRKYRGVEVNTWKEERKKEKKIGTGRISFSVQSYRNVLG